MCRPCLGTSKTLRPEPNSKLFLLLFVYLHGRSHDNAIDSLGVDAPVAFPDNLIDDFPCPWAPGIKPRPVAREPELVVRLGFEVISGLDLRTALIACIRLRSSLLLRLMVDRYRAHGRLDLLICL